MCRTAIPLLGRCLLSKLNVQIVFKKGEILLKIPESKAGGILMRQEKVKEQIPQEVGQAVVPIVKYRHTWSVKDCENRVERTGKTRENQAISDQARG